MNAVPISAGAAATNGQYPIVIFYRAELDVVFVVFHNKGSICSEVRSQKSEVRYQRSEGAVLSVSPGARRWPKRRPAMRKMMPAVPHSAECKSQKCVAGIFSRKPPIQPTRLFAPKKAR